MYTDYLFLLCSESLKCSSDHDSQPLLLVVTIYNKIKHFKYTYYLFLIGSGRLKY